MPTVIPVKFKYAARDLWFDVAGTEALEGDHVICATERGHEIGLATADPREMSAADLDRVTNHAQLRPVLRVASDEDLAHAEELAELGEKALPVFRHLVSQSGLDMKPVGVEYLFDGDKVVCYFSAEERVDFRQLVRDLSRELHERIDMRQIGVREEAAVVGGWGHCGQELCCTRFGLAFEPVSIRMAKEQDLPLNSTKISGACGRLMCCLRYEFEAYRDFKGRAPKRNAVIETPLGKAKIVEYDTPKEEICLRLENGKQVRVPLAEMTASDAAIKKSKDLGCACRPDTVTRDVLERLQSPDVRMALAELDRANGVTPPEGFDDADLFVQPKHRRRRGGDAGDGAASGAEKRPTAGTGAGDVNAAHCINLVDGLQAAGLRLSAAAQEAYLPFVAAEEERTAPINEWRGWWFGEVPYNELPEKDALAAAKRAVVEADAAVITLLRQAGEGKDRLAEPGDFELTDAERTLLTDVCTVFHAAGKKVVVVLNTTGVIETASWKDLPDAILLAWQPGQEAGYAIADVLTGAVNPSGRLPMTWPVRYADVPSQNFPQVHVPERKNASWWHHKKGQRWYEQPNIDWTDYLEDIYIGYRYYSTFDVPVSYPFGYGLSYTTFAMDDLQVTAAKGGWTVSVTVTNTGNVPGKQVVQLYTAPAAAGNYPVCELRGFAKTGELAPGQAETVRISLTPADLAYFDEGRSAWVTPAGTYTLAVGENVAQASLQAPLEVKKEWTKATHDVLHPSQPEGRPLYLGGGSAITR